MVAQGASRAQNGVKMVAQGASKPQNGAKKVAQGASKLQNGAKKLPKILKKGAKHPRTKFDLIQKFTKNTIYSWNYETTYSWEHREYTVNTWVFLHKLGAAWYENR